MFFTSFTLTYNPYLDQLCAQTGFSRFEASREVRASARRTTLEEAQARGFDTVEAYDEALHEFLNGL